MLGLGAGRCDYCLIGEVCIRWQGSGLCLGCAKQLVAQPEFKNSQGAADSKAPMAITPPKGIAPYTCATCGSVTGLPAVGIAIHNPDTDMYWPTAMVFCMGCFPKTTFAHQVPVKLNV